MCAGFLLLGFFFKAQCLSPWDGRQYSRLCYNDIQPLFGIRFIAQNVFPYVDGSMQGTSELTGGAIEYPVLTGVFMWFAGLFVGDNNNSYLIVSAVLMAPFGLFTAYLLGKMSGQRALLWAAAPAVILYAFHNWDLLVVAAAVAGFYAWYRGKALNAAVWFGVGAALKMYPLFFLGPLVLEQWLKGDRRAALQSAGAGVGAVALINLPFAVVNRAGWFATYEFHRLRGPNFDNIWTWLPDWMPDLDFSAINLWSAALTLISFALALGFGWMRGVKEEKRYPFLQTCAALLAIFLLWNKVHSPQYTLWLLPFFVLVRVHMAWWVAYAIVDLVVYVGVFRFFFDQNSAFWRQTMVGGVWARALLLAILTFTFLRSPAALDAPEGAGVRAKLPDPKGDAERSAALEPASAR
ncbi:MAG TPA: hypothetical protein VNC78_00530 [Actinomycetota bacterium]|nr:hypothetical protein [Actinomycetota bacterium]